MSLSKNAVIRLIESMTSESAGNEVATQLNNAAWAIPAAIIAAHVSTTTDFSALLAGDLVLHIPATAGNSSFMSIATKGTLPAAAVVGDLYVALRSSANAIKSVQKL